MKIDSSIAKQNFEEFYKPFKTARWKWLKDAVRHDNFRYGMQYTLNEEADLLKLRQAPLPINITAAICETAEALLMTTSPVITVAPANTSDPSQQQNAKLVADLYKKVNNSTWYNSLGGLHYDKVIRDFDNVGHGLFYLVPELDVNGRFTVRLQHLFWAYFYPDPSSKDILYRDCEAQVISKIVNRQTAFKMVKKFEPELDYNTFVKEYCRDFLIDDPPEGLESPYASYGYNKEKVVRTIITNTIEEQAVVRVVPNIPDLDNIKFKTFLKADIPIYIMELANEGKIQLRNEKKFCLTEKTNVGAFGYEKVYPVDEYNVIPLVYDHRENPYPHGRVWYIYPIQRALNKFVLLTILNASLMNALKFIVEENTIVDEDSWNNFINVPGVRLKWRRVTSNSEPPIPVMVNAFGQGILEYPKFLIWIMEYVTGIWSVMQGSTENAPATFGGIQSVQSAATMKIKRRMAYIDNSLSQVGLVNSKFWREYAPLNGRASYIPKMNEVEQFGYNTLKPMNEIEAGGAEDKVGIVPATDLGIGFEDLRFTTSASRGFERANEAAQLTTLATQLGVPQLLPLILDRMDIPEVDKIVQELDQVKQLTQQVQQQGQALEELDKANKQKSKQLEQLMMKMSTEDFKTKWIRVLERFKGEFKRAGMDAREFERVANSMLFNAPSQQQPETQNMLQPNELQEETKPNGQD